MESDNLTIIFIEGRNSLLIKEKFLKLPLFVIGPLLVGCACPQPHLMDVDDWMCVFPIMVVVNRVCPYSHLAV